MIYKNNFETKKSRHLKLRFNKFSSLKSSKKVYLEPTEAVQCYNFETKNGALRRGIGIKDLVLPYRGTNYKVAPENKQIDGLWYSTWLNSTNQNVQDYLFLLFDGKMHYVEMSLPQYTFALSGDFTSLPSISKVFRNGEESFVFASSEDDCLFLSQLSENTYSTMPKVCDVCYHYDKLFAITAEVKNALVYSTDTDVLNWTSANTERIDFNDNRGRLLKLVCFNDTLYVFREHGITKISQYSMNSDFSIDHVYSSQSLIFEKTISVCGDKILFLTNDGVFSFNGSSVKKHEMEGLERVDLSVHANPCLCCFDGLYYLACRMNFDDSMLRCEEGSYVNNAVIVFNLEGIVQILRGVDVKCFAPVISKNFDILLAIFRGEDAEKIGQFTCDGKLFGQSSLKKWNTSSTSLNEFGKLKCINELKIVSKSDCMFTIKTDEGEKSFDVQGSDSLQRIKIDVKGKIFQFCLSTLSDDPNIPYAEISMTVYE